MKVLVLNTFLLRTMSGPDWLTGRVGTAPVIEARAAELARVVADYDIAALCEVFDADEVEVLAAVRPEFTASATRGPLAGPGQRVSGGLLTLSAMPVLRSTTHRFAAAGSLLHDPDAWAAKGVAMVEVATPSGPNLEVYNTHLIAGDDLVPRRVLGKAPEGVHEVRRQQLAEMVDFVVHHTSPANDALVCGDFNTAADSPDGTAMAEMFASVGFADLWDSASQGPGPTCDLPKQPQCYPPDLQDPRFFADTPTSVSAENLPARIDYALFRPATDRTGPPSITIRRRRLPRHPVAAGAAHFAWMSDHVGLHLEIAERG